MIILNQKLQIVFILQLRLRLSLRVACPSHLLLSTQHRFWGLSVFA